MSTSLISRRMTFEGFSPSLGTDKIQGSSSLARKNAAGPATGCDVCNPKSAYPAAASSHGTMRGEPDVRLCVCVLVRECEGACAHVKLGLHVCCEIACMCVQLCNVCACAHTLRRHHITC